MSSKQLQETNQTTVPASQTIGIVGLGLIGGSIALALKGKKTVIGVDSNPQTAAYCLREGLVAEMTDLEGLKGKGCDVIFVCVPLASVRKTVQSVCKAVGQTAVVTDVGSVKENLSDLEGRIVGGHPMAGTEHSGITAAKARLMENAYYCLVPYKNTRAADLQAVKAIVTDLFKARAVVLSAAEHDRLAAKFSHLPHAVAYSLSSVALTQPAEATIAGTGFMDTTRIASSSPDFWRDVALLNKDNLLAEMDAFTQRFGALYKLIQSSDGDGLQAFFADAKAKRDKLSLSRAYKTDCCLEVDVPDEVGSIGKIASLLASAGINLANIQILSSREGACGALRLEIADEAGYEKAKALLLKQK